MPKEWLGYEIEKPAYDWWFYARLVHTDESGYEGRYQEKRFWLKWRAERWAKQQLAKFEKGLI